MFHEKQQDWMVLIDSICTNNAWYALQVAYHDVYSVQQFTEKWIDDLPDDLDCLLLLSETKVSDHALAYGFQDLLKKGGLYRRMGEVQLNAILKQMQQGEVFVEPFILCLFFCSQKHGGKLRSYMQRLRRQMTASTIFYTPVLDWKDLALRHHINDVSQESRLLHSARTGVWLPLLQSQLYFLNPMGQSLLISGVKGEAARDFEQRCVLHALASGESVLLMDARGEYKTFSDCFGGLRIDLNQYSLNSVLELMKRLSDGYVLIQCLADWKVQDLKTIVKIAAQRRLSLTLVCTGESRIQNTGLCKRELCFGAENCVLRSDGKLSFHQHQVDVYARMMMHIVLFNSVVS